MKRKLILVLLFILVSHSADQLHAAWLQTEPSDPELLKEISEIENRLGPSIQLKSEDPTAWTIPQRMEHYRVPGVSIAVVKDGKLRWAKGYGLANTETKTQVHHQTLFQAGSISKPVAALAALKLVDEGKIDLDEDVNVYLKTWKVPENDFTKTEKVTLRRLLTHTAGMTVHGFPGYSQSTEIPSTVQVLDGEGNTAPIRVDTTPGTGWRYSGGGYTVMQLLVEEVSGVPFAQYLKEEILQPMKMNHSTYEQPLGEPDHPSASAAYNRLGKIINGYWNNYPEQAAAGLWTTPSDLANYCMEIQQIVAGKKNGVLSPTLVKEMLTPDKGNWGLGPSLSGEGDELLFKHGGKNAGFSNDMFAYAHQGVAVIVMTSGDNGMPLSAEIMRAIADQYGWQGQSKQVSSVDLSSETLESFAGKYTLEVNGRSMVILVEGQEKTLKVKIPSQLAIKEIVPVGQTEFVDLSDGTQIEFTKSEDGSVEGFIINKRTKFTKSDDK